MQEPGADLLQSLIQPSHDLSTPSTPDTFVSSHSQLAAQTFASPDLDFDGHTSDMEEDIEAFLDRHSSQLDALAKKRPLDEPVALSAPSSAGNISLLYQLVTTRGLVVSFEHTERSGGGWGCQMTLGRLRTSPAPLITGLLTLDAPPVPAPDVQGAWETFDPNTKLYAVTVHKPGPFSSKKISKEQAAEVGVRLVSVLPLFKGSAATASLALARSATPPSTAGPAPKHAVLARNWIGMLLEYHNSTAAPQPVYQEFATGAQAFACTLLLHERADALFGGTDKAYPSKKVAKASAAKEAFEWLEATGRVAALAARKRAEKEARAMPTAPAAKKPKLDGGQPDGADEAQQAQTPAQGALAQVVKKMGLASPIFQILPQEGSTTHFQCVAEFRGPTKPGTGQGMGMEGEWGRVEWVVGKKRAKEECARRVLGQIRERRAAQGKS